MSGIQNDAEAVADATKATRDTLAALAPTPRRRIEAAIAGRNPEGFTEVFAADVLALAETVTDHSEFSRALKRAAERNLKLAFGKPMPEHRANDFVVAILTKALTDLLRRADGAAD